MKILLLTATILALLVVATIFEARTRGGRARVHVVRQDLTTLQAHLEQYKKVGKIFPSTEQGFSAIVTRPTTDPLPENWVQTLPEIPLDPWGNPYRYQFPGTKNPEEPEITSTGPDQLFGTADDFSSQD